VLTHLVKDLVFFNEQMKYKIDPIPNIINKINKRIFPLPWR